MHRCAAHGTVPGCVRTICCRRCELQVRCFLDPEVQRKQSGNGRARCRLARKPMLRTRTKPRGGRWSRKRRRNSSTVRVNSRFLLRERNLSSGSDITVGEGNEPMVGDGDTMGTQQQPTKASSRFAPPAKPPPNRRLDRLPPQPGQAHLGNPLRRFQRRKPNTMALWWIFTLISAEGQVEATVRLMQHSQALTSFHGGQKWITGALRKDPSALPRRLQNIRRLCRPNTGHDSQ
jgi:hypothetical protein